MSFLQVFVNWLNDPYAPTLIEVLRKKKHVQSEKVRYSLFKVNLSFCLRVSMLLTVLALLGTSINPCPFSVHAQESKKTNVSVPTNESPTPSPSPSEVSNNESSWIDKLLYPFIITVGGVIITVGGGVVLYIVQESIFHCDKVLNEYQKNLWDYLSQGQTGTALSSFKEAILSGEPVAFNRVPLVARDYTVNTLRDKKCQKKILDFLKKNNLFLFLLAYAQFNEVDLSNADLSKYALVGADFSSAILEKTNLDGSLLWDANLHKTKLNGSSFKGALLKGAKFTKADLKNADFGDANIESADFREAKNINVQQIKKAKNWDLGYYDQEFKNLLKDSSDLMQT